MIQNERGSGITETPEPEAVYRRPAQDLEDDEFDLEQQKNVPETRANQHNAQPLTNGSLRRVLMTIKADRR